MQPTMLIDNVLHTQLVAITNQILYNATYE